MTTALVHLNCTKASPVLAPELEAAGIQVLAVVDERSKLVQMVVRHAPDLVICDDPFPDESLFKATQAIADTQACPVLVFTADGDADKMARALDAGIHAYVVNGYGANRLRPLVHLVQARFKREQAQREALQDVSSRFEERKMVDRAKGILMRARQVSDDDAFQILRTASMHSNQRLGQVSQHIIHSARFAESVNRAGQLRMLSQRLVKLYLLQLAGVQAEQTRAHLQESVQRIDGNLALLGKSLSKPTFGDLLGQVVLTWGRLKKALKDEPRAEHLVELDALAELLLQEAERLTASLENAGSVAPLHVLNMAGRQRMLSQRFAKYVLLAVLGGDAARPLGESGLAEARDGFEQGLRYLNEIPLSTPDIRSALDEAAVGWQHMLAGAMQAGGVAGRERLANASESLLDGFEQLSGHYERSMQMLVG
ncbi:MAG: type IV pili methyl-accepting chemotaxis transducer N-terminal domain-containing protein [Pseudomonadota bacterium]